MKLPTLYHPHLGCDVSGLVKKDTSGAHGGVFASPKLPDAAELLMHATEFLFCACPKYEWEIHIRKRWQPDGSHLWAVYFGDRRVWDKKARQFVHEGGDALDCDRHLRRCRFKSLKEAWKQASLGVQARRAQEAEWDRKREETEAHMARFRILDRARTGSLDAYQAAKDDHGIGLWELTAQDAAFVTEDNKPKVALHTPDLVEHNAEALRKAFVAKFGEHLLMLPNQ